MPPAARPQKNHEDWKESLLYYFQSDLALDLDQQISIPKILTRVLKQYGQKTALQEKVDGRYVPISYLEMVNHARAFAKSVIEDKIPPQSTIALLLGNSPAWVYADLGTQFAGGITVPIYHTLVPEAIKYILNDSQAKMIVIEDDRQLEKILAIEKELPHLQKIIVHQPGDITFDSKIVSFKQFLENGFESAIADHEIDNRVNDIKRDHLASLVYTSGTTGNPKGVMLTHRNFLSNAYAMLSITKYNYRDRFLSVLPLSHVFERTGGYYMPLLCGASIGYAESIQTMEKDFGEIKPTVCCVVPRILEKLYEKMNENFASLGLVQKTILNWSFKVSDKVWAYLDKKNKSGEADRRFRHRPEDRWDESFSFWEKPWLTLQHWLAHFLVYRKVQARFGGKLRMFIAGGAALSPKIAEFFKKFHIMVYEGYGLTETSPVIAFNYESKYRPGTVGKLLPNIQIKFSEEGEILVKGPSVMAGYFNKPKETREAIDENGWFHTGDVGCFDDGNYLKITDRIKELIVLNTGKKVAPLPIEQKMALSPLVAQAMLVGNNEKYIACLIFPAIEKIKSLAKKEDLKGEVLENLCENENIRKPYMDIVHAINAELSNFEQIKKFELVPYDLAKDHEVLTPTLKLKKKLVAQKFKSLIEKMYA